MIRHLTEADFRPMPWANGKGVTVELAREDDAQGMVWRLSRAKVVEDGAFSHFPGVDRNLTVIAGPGFDLVGDLRLRADPLVPVAFPGDVALAARGVAAPSEDFNVMVRRGTMRAEVSLKEAGRFGPGLVAILALDAVVAAGRALARLDLLLADEPVDLSGRALVVRFRAV